MKRPWIPHGPEDRLSIVMVRFLEDGLEPPFYVTALADDDEGGRTEMQRIRGRERGQKPGQFDFDVVQGCLSADRRMVPLCRKLELKRGKNGLSEHQKVTEAKLIACGARPIIAWGVRGAWFGLEQCGFKFRGNAETLAQKYEAQLDALDRDAELRLTGTKPVRAVRTKAQPRSTASKAMVRRAAANGVRIP